MCSLPVFVGMDYHDSFVRVVVQDTDGSELGNADRTNHWKAIADFGDRFGRPVRAAIESCCGAADLAEELVSCAGWSVALAPSRLRPAHETEPGQNGLPGRPVAGGFGAGRLSAAGVVGAPLHPRVTSCGSLPVAVDRATAGHQVATAGIASGATLSCPRRVECLDEGLAALGASDGGAQRARSLAGGTTLGRTGAFGHPDSRSGEATRAPDHQRRGSAALATAAGHWPGDGLDDPGRDRSL